MELLPLIQAMPAGGNKGFAEKIGIGEQGAFMLELDFFNQPVELASRQTEDVSIEPIAPTEILDLLATLVPQAKMAFADATGNGVRGFFRGFVPEADAVIQQVEQAVKQAPLVLSQKLGTQLPDRAQSSPVLDFLKSLQNFLNSDAEGNPESPTALSTSPQLASTITEGIGKPVSSELAAVSLTSATKTVEQKNLQVLSSALNVTSIKTEVSQELVSQANNANSVAKLTEAPKMAVVSTKKEWLPNQIDSEPFSILTESYEPLIVPESNQPAQELFSGLQDESEPQSDSEFSREKGDQELKADFLGEKPKVSHEATVKAASTEGRVDLEPRVAARQIVEKARDFLAARQPGEVSIVMEPEKLGTVSVTVRQVDGKLETNFVVSNDSLRQSLQANRAELIQAAEKHGLSLGSFDVSQQSSKQQSNLTKQDFERTSRLSHVTAAPSTTTSVSAYRRPDLVVDTTA